MLFNKDNNGTVEHTYMQQKGMEHSAKMMERIMCGSEDSPKPPCIIYCREIWIEDEIVDLANKYKVPLLRSKKATSPFMAELIRWLNAELAPRCSIHGVLVDIVPDAQKRVTRSQVPDGKQCRLG